MIFSVTWSSHFKKMMACTLYSRDGMYIVQPWWQVHRTAFDGMYIVQPWWHVHRTV